MHTGPIKHRAIANGNKMNTISSRAVKQLGLVQHPLSAIGFDAKFRPILNLRTQINHCACPLACLGCTMGEPSLTFTVLVS